MSTLEIKENHFRLNFSSILIKFGLSLIGFALLILLFTFLPLIKQEIKYSSSVHENSEPDNKKFQLIPVNSSGSIVIPKIGINSRIIFNINPLSAKDYQNALSKGVAHALNTSKPDENGNMFLFAHSSVNWYEANKYNSIFYLNNKLEVGDSIFIYYLNKKYSYKVKEKKIVNPEETFYLKKETDKRILTLMTCWPPGTTFQRLIVIAQQVPLP